MLAALLDKLDIKLKKKYHCNIYLEGRPTKTVDILYTVQWSSSGGSSELLRGVLQIFDLFYSYQWLESIFWNQVQGIYRIQWSFHGYNIVQLWLKLFNPPLENSVFLFQRKNTLFQTQFQNTIHISVFSKAIISSLNF